MNDGCMKIFKGLQEFRDYADKVGNERNLAEKLIGEENKGKDEWKMIGYCECCSKPTRFLLDWKCSDGKNINFRERLSCEYCGLNSRQRFIASYVIRLINKQDAEVGKRATVYCYEYVTKFYGYLRNNFDAAKVDVIGSEYLGFDRKPGEAVNGIRHEDAMNLSFSSDSIDYIISNDVYEHVPDIMKSLKEAYRVIKKDGKLIFSIPFYCMQNEIKQRALLKEGNIINILPEQYHGNPISDKGSLVFYDFGWDILRACKEVGFKDAYVITGYSMLYGYMGTFPMVFVAEK